RWSDFPRHATFVPFLHEMLRYLTAGRVRATDYLIGELPPGVARVPGIAKIPGETASNSQPRPIAVNVDARESTLTRTSDEEFQAAVDNLKSASAAPEVRNEVRREEERQHLWQYVLAAIIAVLTVEGLLASRAA